MAVTRLAGLFRDLGLSSTAVQKKRLPREQDTKKLAINPTTDIINNLRSLRECLFKNCKVKCSKSRAGPVASPQETVFRCFSRKVVIPPKTPEGLSHFSLGTKFPAPPLKTEH